ncbi:MAG: zinc-ribbon and DUF3426 domain-containing protein [Burkholderiaceae bacterium]|nr:zinc-ribbon and DUF3426 domain-containing protein [Burkholderiaceae bacterium]
MALATRCPYCSTTFRVVQDQLKLFNGIVRCGNCRQIFNGVEQLLPDEEIAPADRREAAPPVQRVAEATQSNTLVDTGEDLNLILSTSEDEVEFDQSSLVSTPEPAFTEEEYPDPTPAQKPSGFAALPELDLKAEPRKEPHFAELIQPSAAELRLDPVEADPAGFPGILEAKQAQVYSDNVASFDEAPPVPEAAAPEPDFVKRARRQQRSGRVWRIVMWFGVLVMFPIMLLQAVDAFHDRIVASFPQLKPVLAPVCELTGCPAELYRQIDSLSVEVSELQAPSNNETAYTLNVVLRNRSRLAQAWPNLELTLNDSNEKPVARRVFTAADYLPSSQIATSGFGASSEQSVKLVFDLDQIKPAGYRVYLFYP